MQLLCSMNILKQKAIAILEKTVIKTGTVLDVRAWEPATFFEIDLYLPETDMQGWTTVQHMKCKVAPATYRDYTPAGWDADTHTCTLYIDTAHDGPGSQWAASLHKGDTIQYMGIASTFHKPQPQTTLVYMGDSSSIGHFLAMQQLAGATYTVTGAIALAQPEHRQQFAEYFHLPVTTVNAGNKGGLDHLANWLQQQQFTSNTTVYIAGHIPTSVQLRKQLRQRNDIKGSIKVQGFWS